MSPHPLHFFVLERELDEWLRAFASENELVLLRKDIDGSVRKISWGALRADAREQPLVHLGPRSELAGLPLEKAIHSPEFVMIALPIETTKIADGARRAHVESSICGTQRPCLVMGQVTPWKVSPHQLFRAIRRALSSLAPLRVSIEEPSGARTEARGLRASLAALEWQTARGELRQAGVTKVRYRVEPM
ncbi:MAG: hypothetical protein M3Y87_14395 [Myxococcota bacterium]|nr:hypothetical protein [Myxococcota bacterium]